MQATLLYNGQEVTIEQAFIIALELLSQNRFVEMTSLCRIIAKNDPLHFRAIHGIGLGLHRSGNSEEGIKYIHRAVEINPEYCAAYNNLGNILREEKRFLEALEAYTSARGLDPASPMIYSNIGAVLNELGRDDEALASYEKALELDPAHIDAKFGYALTLCKLSRNDDAQHALIELLSLKPDHFDAMYNLSTLYMKMKRPKEAYNVLRKILDDKPDHFNANLSLANLLSEQVQFGRNWARDEELEFFIKASDIQPDNIDLHICIGTKFLEMCEIDCAIERYEKALSLQPGNLIAISCMLMASQYHPKPDLKQLYEDSLQWHHFCSANMQMSTSFHKNTTEPDRQLNIGYISADFNMHPVGFHLLPAIYHHNPGKYRVYCYSNNSKKNDAFTHRISELSDEWREIEEMTDDEVYDLIIKDRIDILVDLSGHTAGNRLPLFVRKPAPVQVTWLGYFFSTGLSEIDYIFMDETAVQAGEDQFFSEQVIRLPQTRFCYEPPSYAPDIKPLPCLKNGYITFGSFNNLAKLTPEVVNLWSKVLLALPNSKLLLKSASLGGKNVREKISSSFEQLGINPDRLDLRPASPHADMLAEYGDMDIALDPFPFNGGLTTCESLLMGVPVITLFGNRPISRQTAGFLNTIGLAEFVAHNNYDYIETARKWGANIAELAEIRATMRTKMKHSLLCDGKKFTANLEKIYREIWRQWCGSRTD